MKKTVLAFLISIPLLSGVSLASSSLSETLLLPAGNLSALMLSAAPVSAPEPEPAPEPDFSRITLNPRLVSTSSAQAIIEPN
ncbi:MAG: hypothetical protein NTW38_11090, partial [Candidatus Aminicenantes bacterium]|nr:hypothetical protein [Candidatus Aminicenantes bacterium]